jgi:NTP pyrophosphatase (non-canonical NTP hydrolase)
MSPALWALLGFVSGAFTGAGWALAWRPYRWGCPRCRTIVGSAWKLGRHLEACGRPAAGESVSALKLRPEVEAFAQLMEQKLRQNDHKDHWSHEEPGWLLKRLHGEADELGGAVRKYRLDVPPTCSTGDRWRIGAEAADVANFAMMIADVCGALHRPTGGGLS